jgi:hypothetical protein
MDPMTLQANEHLNKTSAAIASAQGMWRQTQNANFYAMLPSSYHSFYTNWVKQWLAWYDGYVPYIHGGQCGLLSTGIGTTLVNRCADQVFGGNIMFANSRKPKLVEMTDDGKKVGKALDFISNDWIKRVNGKTILKRCGKDALGGGFALLKLNKRNNELWLDELRADRFYIDKTATEIRKCTCVLSFYDNTTDSSQERYALIEERRYEEIGILGEEIPVVEYKMYKTSVPVQYFTGVQDNCIKWDNLPKSIKKAFKNEYGAIKLNEPRAMNGFKNLGVYLMMASDGVSSVPQVNLGESILANITTYLYEYDFYNTCFNTDMYLARGRVMVPKPMQGPRAMTGSQPSGLDTFLLTHYEALNNENNKPEAIQFALRAAEWKEARNILMESIATGIGISVSTLASYISDASNRTAREVSAEESATTLFVENMRRRLEVPINDMLRDVLRFYGYVDDVEIRWTRAGMTNQSVLVDTLSKAAQSGLISGKKAHHAFNFDDDEEQNEEDYNIMLEERKQQREDEMSYNPGPFNEGYEDSNEHENNEQNKQPGFEP